MKKVTHIIIHCSYSHWGCRNEIEKWHLERGFKEIGYNFVILNGRYDHDDYIPSLDGAIEVGRDIDVVGAHALGYNGISIGICLIGKDGQFTSRQMIALMALVRDLMSIYVIPKSNVIGHNETPHAIEIGKTCPQFEVKTLRKSL